MRGVLVLEVVVDQPECRIGFRGDGAHRESVQSTIGDHHESSIEQVISSLALGHAASVGVKRQWCGWPPHTSNRWARRQRSAMWVVVTDLTKTTSSSTEARYPRTDLDLQ